MHQQGNKHCQRCGRLFECKADDITQCQCYGIHLNADELQIISEQFGDCICLNCLNEIRVDSKTRNVDWDNNI
jgi:hypothetical protein